MNNVVHLPKKPTVIWVCACGCATFELHADDLARCAMCGEVAGADNANGGWFGDETPSAETTYFGEDPVRDVHGNGNIEFARRLAAKRAASPTSILSITVLEDGTVYAWAGAETDEQYAWVQDRIEQAKTLLDRKAKE